MSLWGKSTSVWLDTTPSTNYETLADELTVDVAVAGGGIAGLVAAYFLSQQGLKVAVVETLRIVQDVTGYTLGKITSEHGQRYGLLARTLGQEKAQVYADANMAALERIVSIIQSNGIDCDFKRADAFLYTEFEENIPVIKAEVEQARRLGLPASYTGETPLPFARGAMRFENQAQFHPRRYLLFLAREIVAAGGFIFEETRALDIVEDGVSKGGVDASPGVVGESSAVAGAPGKSGKGAVLKTDRGDIRAGNVVVATNTPFYRRERFAQLLTPRRRFVLGIRLDGPVPEGLHYSVDPYGGSIRNQPVGEEKLLLVSSWDDNLRPSDFQKQFAKVESYARTRLPVRSIDYHWFHQDQQTPDRVPFIGRLPESRSVLVAAGFGGWGMTTSCAAAMILTDLITGRDNPWAALYDPARIF